MRYQDAFLDNRRELYPRGTAVHEINKAQPTDSGTYTCIAENVAGRSEGQIQILVESNDPLPPVVEPTYGPGDEEEIVFTSGTDATLRCTTGTVKVIGKYLPFVP